MLSGPMRIGQPFRLCPKMVKFSKSKYTFMTDCKIWLKFVRRDNMEIMKALYYGYSITNYHKIKIMSIKETGFKPIKKFVT